MVSFNYQNYPNANDQLADALGIAQSKVSSALSCIPAQLWLHSTSAGIITEWEKGLLSIEI